MVLRLASALLVLGPRKIETHHRRSFGGRCGAHPRRQTRSFVAMMKSSRLCVYDSIATFHPVHLPLTWNKRKRKKGKKFNKIVCEQRAQQCRRIVRVSHPDNCRSCFFVDKNEGTKRERAADSTVQGRVETFSATKKKVLAEADSSNFLLNAISECFPSTCTLVLEGGKKLVEEEEKKRVSKVH